MKDIFTRIYRIGRAYMPRPRWLSQVLTRSSKAEEFYSRFFGQGFEDFHRFDRENAEEYQADKDSGRESYPGIPQQVIDDLAVFNLKPPASLDEIKSARNREIKKYHSDHFLHDPEKYETSKQIMQIYNAAYDRLKTYYENRGKSA